jgi:beta-mannosidase
VSTVEKAKSGKIAVLAFHGVPDLDHPWVNTDPAVFAKYMKYLHDNGYKVIALRDLAKYVDPAKGPADPLAPIMRRLEEKRKRDPARPQRSPRERPWWLGPRPAGSTAAPKTGGGQREFACTAPSTPEEVTAAVKRLREVYAPYLRSLPRPLEVRTRAAVGNEWRFKFELAQAKEGTEKPEPPEWFREDFDDSSWDKVTVPEWRYIAKKPQKNRRSISCISWYRTRFSAESPKSPRRTFLVFGGVDWEAEVWLNGKFLGSHKVYCEPFRFDVTSLLKKTNTLAVRVIDGPFFGEPHAYWSIFPDSPAGDNQRYVPDRSRSVRGYQKSSIHIGNGFGIFREVYLETTGETCVSEIFARGDLKKQCVRVKVEMDAAAADDVAVEVQVLPENFEGRRYRKTVSCRAPKGPSTRTLSIPMPEAKLWSPQSPRLYRCRVIVRRDRQVIDAKDVLFGYRSFSIVSRKNPYPGLPDGMFLLNGRPIFLRGTSVQGLNLLSYWNERDKLVDCILMLKAANFNAVRVCQHVNFPEVRELFDRLGIMSEQDQGGGRNRDRKKALADLAVAGTALARVCYNNPGVVLLSFANETRMEPREIIDAVLAVDDERIVKPISGNHNKSPRRYDLPDSYWSNVIDDFHTYIGWFNEWYGPPWEGQIWGFNQKYEGRRAITAGEYGAEGMDAYETMRDHYPAQFGPTPPPETDTLWGHIQTRKADKRQIAGFGGKRPANLGEYIEASQNYQAVLLAEITKGFRLSPRRISGYFHFHFINVLAVNWPKAIVSHDLRPKKGYLAMAQVNQPLVPLFRITDRGARMEVWVANDLPKGLKGCKVRWRVDVCGTSVFIHGQKSVDVAASNAVLVEKVDLSAVPREVTHVTVSLTLLSPTGDTLSKYEQKVFLKAWRLEDAIFE